VPKWLVRRKFASFGRDWNYDLGYAREILDEAGIDALRPLNALNVLSAYRGGVPNEAHYAARVTAAIAGDCGPCAQLMLTMAQRAGVDRDLLRALADGDRDALSEDARLGFDLARMTLDRDPAGEDVRAEVLARWGRRGLAALAYGIVAGQGFPTLKYALGHGHACTILHVPA
jgi:hypothetical protein